MDVVESVVVEVVEVSISSCASSGPKNMEGSIGPNNTIASSDDDDDDGMVANMPANGAVHSNATSINGSFSNNKQSSMVMNEYLF